MSSEDVGIVLPAYEPDVVTLKDYVGQLQDEIDPAVIRIELDAPTDSIKAAIKEIDGTVAISETRRGKGMAITAGFEALDTDVIAFADADGAVSASSMDAIIQSVSTGEVDLAVGSRLHPNATVKEPSTKFRQTLRRGFVAIARISTGLSLSDFQCGAKAIDRHCWEAIRTQLTRGGFDWDLEMLALAAQQGCRIGEVPVTWSEHPQSTVEPVHTSISLAVLAGRIGLARATGSFEDGLEGTPLLEQITTDDEALE